MIGAHESVPDLSPATVIGLHSRWRSGAEAIVHPKETVTFRDLWQRATEVASDLAAAGSGPRDRVAIALEPAIATFVKVDLDVGLEENESWGETCETGGPGEIALPSAVNVTRFFGLLEGLLEIEGLPLS